MAAAYDPPYDPAWDEPDPDEEEGDDGEAESVCPFCNGHGEDRMGQTCLVCRGTGKGNRWPVPDFDDDDEGRRD